MPHPPIRAELKRCGAHITLHCQSVSQFERMLGNLDDLAARYERGDDEPSQEEDTYQATIQRFEERLRAAYPAKRTIHELATEFNEYIAQSEWPEYRVKAAREHFNTVFQELQMAHPELPTESKDNSHDGELETTGKEAARTVQKEGSALDQIEVVTEETLPAELPMRDALVEAGLKTPQQVRAAYNAGSLTDVSSIGKTRAIQIAQALGLDSEGRVNEEMTVPTIDGSALINGAESISE